jgi:DNA invertase Pin-like site-specific DNA recombinase
MIYGYIRVSTVEQKLDRQYDAMISKGVSLKNIFVDKKSGKNFDRDGYQHVKAALVEGDLLYVDSLDRLGRDYDGIINEWKEITRKINADIVCLDKADLFDSRKFKEMGDIGKVIEDTILSTMAYVAEQERKKMLQRQHEGIAAAKQRGTYNPGRPRVQTQGFTDVYRKTQACECTIKQAISELGISRSTWQRLVSATTYN